jgi:hypothetical protein
MYKRQFTNTNKDHFEYLMCDKKWKEAVESNEPSISFMMFMNIFIHYFNVAFPVNKVNHMEQRWITKSLFPELNYGCYER